MTTLHQAIFALNPAIVTVRDEVAYDQHEQVVAYDMVAAQAKLTELQAAENAAEQAAAAHKASAVSKLTELGLSADEINALIG